MRLSGELLLAPASQDLSASLSPSNVNFMRALPSGFLWEASCIEGERDESLTNAANEVDVMFGVALLLGFGRETSQPWDGNLGGNMRFAM